MFIGVIGGNNCTQEEARIAETVGREIAKYKAILVCGGLKGIMKAACKGAKQENGLTIGILPGNNRKEANQFIDIPIVTGLGHARNIIVVNSSQAIIAINGGYGTLSEIAYALINSIPVISINSWHLDKQKMKKDDRIISITDPVLAVEKAINLIRDK